MLLTIGKNSKHNQIGVTEISTFKKMVLKKSFKSKYFQELNLYITFFFHNYRVDNFLQFDTLHYKNEHLVLGIFQFCWEGGKTDTLYP